MNYLIRVVVPNYTAVYSPMLNGLESVHPDYRTIGMPSSDREHILNPRKNCFWGFI